MRGGFDRRYIASDNGKTRQGHFPGCDYFEREAPFNNSLHHNYQLSNIPLTVTSESKRSTQYNVSAVIAPGTGGAKGQSNSSILSPT